MGGNLIVADTTDLNNTLTVQGATKLMNTLNVAKATTLDGTLTGNNSVKFESDLVVQKDTTVNGTTTLMPLIVQKTLTVNESTELQGALKAVQCNLQGTTVHNLTVDTDLTVKNTATVQNECKVDKVLRVRESTMLNKLLVRASSMPDPPAGEMPADGDTFVHGKTRLSGVLDVLEDTTLKGSKFTVTQGVTTLQNTNVVQNLNVTHDLTVTEGRTTVQMTD